MTDPQQQPEPGQAATKRKRLWIVGGIAAVILVAVIVAAAVIVGRTGGRDPAAGVDDAPAAPAGDEVVTVTYEVSGDADRAARITYSTDENLNLSQQSNVELPWTTDIPLPGTFRTATLALTVQSGGDPGEITCRILRDDEVISEKTASGPYAVVTCSGG